MRLRAFGKLGLGLAALAIALGAQAVGLLDRLEERTIDQRFSARGTDRHDDVVLIGIDPDSLDRLGGWPFKRRYHARVIRRLHRAGVRGIAYDVQFTESTRPRDDYALIDAVGSAPGTVLSTTSVYKSGGTAVLGGEPTLRALHARAASTVLPADRDGRVRRVPYSIAGLTSFGVAGAELGVGHRIDRSGFGGDGALIDFQGPPGTIRTYSFSDVMDGKVPSRLLRDKIAVVGATDVTLKDVFDTPTSGDETMAGAEIQASAISTVMRGVPLRSAPQRTDLLILLVMALAVPLASVRLRMRWSGVLAMVLGGGFAGAAVLLFDHGHVLKVVAPLLALGFATAATLAVDLLHASRERRRVRSLFARFVPESVVSDLVERSGGVPLGGSRMDATVMFIDLRGFTRFAEDRPADQVVEVLNRYLGEMSEAILDHGGTVVSFMGDGVMAVFGSPIERPDHADAALAAALEMLDERIQGINRWLAARDMGPFAMGVGLNSGEVMSGNVGSERRLEYAAIGDTTNVAARLESATKGVPGGLLVSDATYSRLHSRRELLVEHGSLELAGRDAAIRTWRLLEPVEDVRPPSFEQDRPARSQSS